MIAWIRKHPHMVLLTACVVVYALYFSTATILRARGLHAHYFDLGIMHQATYNSYKALVSGDWGRMLEMTNPFGPEQIKRMAIHNDVMLALLSPFYLLHDGPETLLVIQSVVLALGAFAVYGIARHIFGTQKQAGLFSLVFALAYLLNPLIQRTNMYEFHSVTLATSTLLYMFLFWLKRRYTLSFVFFILSILTKEQVPLTTAFFALYALGVEMGWWRSLADRMGKLYQQKHRSHKKKTSPLQKSQTVLSKQGAAFALGVFTLSVAWFLISMKVMIPSARVESDWHFAQDYYAYLGDTPLGIVLGVFLNPGTILGVLFAPDRLLYVLQHTGSFGFLAFLSPLTILIAAPEYGINLLSTNDHMRNTYFHYTAVITPFMIISAIYGTYWVLSLLERHFSSHRVPYYLMGYLVVWNLFFAHLLGPLPGSLNQDIDSLLRPREGSEVVQEWARRLEDESLVVSTSGKLAPFFTNRQYFYIISSRYAKADYVIVRREEVYHEWGSEWSKPAYHMLIADPAFELIDKRAGVEVYEKK